jgi:hypothetical protein
MPIYAPEVIDDEDLKAVWHYVRTLADGYAAGPAQVMLNKKDAPPASSPLAIPGEESVADRARVFRVAMPGTSGRAVAIGLTNGMSYAFDPRFLSVRNIWSGGFLNLKEERTVRGGKASVPGSGAKVHLEGGPLLAALTISLRKPASRASVSASGKTRSLKMSGSRTTGKSASWCAAKSTNRNPSASVPMASPMSASRAAR